MYWKKKTPCKEYNHPPLFYLQGWSYWAGIQFRIWCKGFPFRKVFCKMAYLLLPLLLHNLNSKIYNKRDCIFLSINMEGERGALFHFTENKKSKAWHALHVTERPFTWQNREPKQTTFLTQGWRPEANISHSTTVVCPRVLHLSPLPVKRY